MSFHSYLKNIESKTGETPESFADLAVQKGFMENGLRGNVNSASIRLEAKVAL